MHFGARSCKACAAFFRRTVAFNVVYECEAPAPCGVHYEKRMICKKCRYDKCIAANMNRELVRSTRGADRSAPAANETSSKVPDIAFVATSKDTTARDSLLLTGYSEVLGIPVAPNQGRESRRWVIYHCKRMEATLNNRRRIMYTNEKMISVFTKMHECPYEKRHLKPLNYREYVGNTRSDFIMLYDFTIAFLQFAELEAFEKNFFYRSVCGVDSLLNLAYFTCCLSYEDNWMVVNSCEYICIDPMPMTGDEPWAQDLFATKKDKAKYKSIVPRLAAYWHTLVVPFHRLNLQFDEFCLLKVPAEEADGSEEQANPGLAEVIEPRSLSITSLRLSGADRPVASPSIGYHKFGENGRRICVKQRNLLINCLNDLVVERTNCPEVRIGDLILFISCVFQRMLELVNSLVMITFFDIFEYDDVLREFFTFDSS
ncbi:hypothetical protein RB195_017830 [Necator americanus]|uniref:Zinc finger, C4 type n=1 Tax=Necator americanus TaxID=51031 RepID=A0ABR1C6Y4_NECAM